MNSNGEGHRQSMLEKQRQKIYAESEKERQKNAKLSEVRVGSDKFVKTKTDIESQLKSSTIGLTELKDYRKIRENLEEQQKREAASTAPLGDEKRKKKKKKQPLKLSFADDDDEEEEEEEASEEEVKSKKRRMLKDPTIDTSFLPDREREEKERIEREELRKEWILKQEEIKNELINITYSFWDGSGHRKVVKKCKKGDSIQQFLEACRQQFPQLRGVNVDNLLYIKEDLIIPHHYTFYDFIINKARGKSGPLFNFDVHDDVRLINDATIEKDESHAGKVVERSWYERNKHIFPASRWEVFDPAKSYGKYKIKDSGQKAF
ncbi:FAM50A protein [Pilaira anomala]|nr:FAM50A protein [Pilaira anomala]